MTTTRRRNARNVARTGSWRQLGAARAVTPPGRADGDNSPAVGLALPPRARSERRPNERHAVRGGWRSEAPSRDSQVNGTAGKPELSALAFTADSNRGGMTRTAPIPPGFIHLRLTRPGTRS